MSLLQLFRQLGGQIPITTANLRKALRMNLDRSTKNRLYSIYLNRRQSRRR